jgi:hypothetical protein
MSLRPRGAGPTVLALLLFGAVLLLGVVAVVELPLAVHGVF